jgi:hypothetical protein
MTPSAAIDALDRAIKQGGQTSVTLRRLPTIDVQCPATVRDYEANELADGIVQNDSHVIISATQINTATWPEAQTPGTKDVRIPSKNRGDLVIINNRVRKVQNAKAFYIADTLVRIEIQVR